MPGLPERSPDQAFTPPSGTLPGGACRGYQTVARVRRLRRHPGHSPAARRLPELPERSPDQAFTPPSGTLPGGAALAGATRP
ncbi:TPA: hypothetical protein I8287_000217 [Kluyvera intermedia]|nr:hypothetical protein [Kluyvera intermedia]